MKRRGRKVEFSECEDFWRVKLPEVVAFAEDQVGARVQRGTDFAQSTVAASAFEAVLVPVNVQRLTHNFNSIQQFVNPTRHVGNKFHRIIATSAEISWNFIKSRDTH